MDGYSGKILHVDLTRGDIRAEEYPNEWRSLYIGGRGLGTRLLLDAIDPRIDPMSPQNVLIFSAGPLTGTTLP
ncbi:MAG TPA: aldehyde ferredoxin oxidoreductase N-terminal domain-containing protein, partial [Methanomicrobiales archaeon]|nr:aldehyde ferredoxin oxidoreductase N-terminal domain-containing protein [Methanomicrobiales archaeon]